MKNLKILEEVSFPSPTGININMMPFIIGDDNSIPEEYKSYLPIIHKCHVSHEEIGKIGYLSINESLVSAGTSQRRNGIHTEKHPSASWGGGGGGAWGGKKGGLFLASNIEETTRAWDYHVEQPGNMGDCEHLRHQLEFPIMLPANKLVWMTDSCPHEALVQKETRLRQWFRFVTSEVSLWYKLHSTENRLGIKPNCRIITETKF